MKINLSYGLEGATSDLKRLTMIFSIQVEKNNIGISSNTLLKNFTYRETL